MNETTFGREPLEVVEIIVPKCVNVHGSSPCTATQTGNAKCFNTRATCNDADNFQARPLSYLTPDLLLASGETIDNTAIDFTADALIEVDVRFKANSTGTIFAVGSATNFLYFGITGTDIVLAAGGTTAADQARVTTPVAAQEGRERTMIAAVDYTNDRVRLYQYCPLELELKLLGEDAADTALPAAWAGATDGVVGGDSGITYGSEDGGTFNGVISSVRVYSDQTATLLANQDAYRERYFFDDGRKAKPSDDLYILPMLLSASTVGTRLNLTGTDSRYEPLGRRSFLELSMADAPHSDHPFDPYRADRTYDPLTRSTFWLKWLQRQKFGKTRALVRLYHGYHGDRLADMVRQSYVLDAISWSREQVGIRCRDFLSLTEFTKAQVPEPSNGKLHSAITDSATTMELTGDVTEEYPATGTVRIDDELITYTGRTYNSGTERTDFTGLTRGADGSTASEQDADEAVQLCRRYTNARIDDVLEELIVTDARVPAQVVDLDKFTSETDESLSAYNLTTLISEPTGVDRLIGELAEQCAFYVWWNERRQIIDLQAIKPLIGVDKTFTQEEDIIGESFSLTERPKERITTVSFFYNPRDFAGDLDKPSNYKNQDIVSNSTGQGPDQYGNLPQTREIFSRWLTTSAEVLQTASRYSRRYVDVPIYCSFLVDAKDRETWVGDLISISHDRLVDAHGERDILRRFLVIEAEEVEPGHAQRLTCVDITLDGLIYLITPDGTGAYDRDTFIAERYAYITDDDGLNPDGTLGATIG